MPCWTPEWSCHEAVVGRQLHCSTQDGLRAAGWGTAPEASGADSLGVHISNLRRRLSDAGAGGLVQTVRGKGYRIDLGAAND